MRSLTRLFSAFGTLADSLLALTGVLDGATNQLRQQLAVHREPVPILEHEPNHEPAPEPEVNGTRKSRKTTV